MPSPLRDVPLAPRTTLGVGGFARFFWEVSTEDELVAAVDWARQRGLDLCVLGGGSNVVVSDDGFPGLVIKLSIRGIFRGNASDDRVEAETSSGVGALEGLEGSS